MKVYISKTAIPKLGEGWVVRVAEDHVQEERGIFWNKGEAFLNILYPNRKVAMTTAERLGCSVQEYPSCEEVAGALLRGEFREMTEGEACGWAGAADDGRVWDWNGVQVCISYLPGDGLRVDATDGERVWSYDLRNATVEEV